MRKTIGSIGREGAAVAETVTTERSRPAVKTVEALPASSRAIDGGEIEPAAGGSTEKESVQPVSRTGLPKRSTSWAAMPICWPSPTRSACPARTIPAGAPGSTKTATVAPSSSPRGTSALLSQAAEAVTRSSPAPVAVKEVIASPSELVSTEGIA